MVKVLIGGDYCPIGGNTEAARQGDAEGLYHDLLGHFRAADLIIANLECPLITRPSPIRKTGPTFGEAPECINGVTAGGIDVLCLANNHILDHGPEGLASTLAVCRSAGVATVGAGRNLAEASRILIKDIGSLRIGILAMAEHEFSIATPTAAGANPIDLIAYVRTVKAAREEFDYLIVLLHGGPEFLDLPSPRLKETCHFLVEMGANAVILQHSHSLGGYESYLGGHIVYGQGALVMDEAIYRNRKCFHECLLVALNISGKGTATLELIPFAQSHLRPGACLYPPGEAKALLARVAEKAGAILDDERLEAAWRRFCDEQKHEYVSALLGHSRWLRKLDRNGWLTRLFYDRLTLLRTRNIVTCETHRDAVETILTRLAS